MSDPIFFLQIVDKNGRVAHLPGGGPLEVNLHEVITKAIMSKGVGFFKTEKSVERSIREGIREAILNLKMETIKLI